MNAAQQIIKSVYGLMNSMDYTDALAFCTENMDVIEKVNETTIFEAADGSKLKFDGISCEITLVLD